MGRGTAELAGFDGSGDARDWQQWGAEVDGLGDHLGPGRVYIARPVGRASVFGVSSGVAKNAYQGWIMPSLLRVGELAIHTDPPTPDQR